MTFELKIKTEMDLENVVNFTRQLMQLAPDEDKSNVLKEMKEIYSGLPSCKQADDYYKCMRLKLSFVYHKIAKKYKIGDYKNDTV